MNNPFDELNSKLNHITDLILDLKDQTRQPATNPAGPTAQKLVKIEEAAKITSYSKGYIYELVFNKAIPFIRRGRSLRFDPDELDAWMRAGRPSVIQKTIKLLKEQE